MLSGILEFIRKPANISNGGLTQGIGDVSGDHEIQLGNWHHGRVAAHNFHQKNHFRKYFPAFWFLHYKNVPTLLILPSHYSTAIHVLSILGQELRGNIFQSGFSGSQHV